MIFIKKSKICIRRFTGQLLIFLIRRWIIPFLRLATLLHKANKIYSLFILISKKVLKISINIKFNQKRKMDHTQT